MVVSWRQIPPKRLGMAEGEQAKQREKTSNYPDQGKLPTDAAICAQESS